MKVNIMTSMSFFLFMSMLSMQVIQGFSITYKDQKEPLHKGMIEAGLKKYDSLNELEHFNTERIKKDAAFQQEAFALENTQKIQVIASDGQIIEAFFVDRGAAKVLLLGQGFKARKEYLLPFLKLFPDYDLLFFDYHLKHEVIPMYLHHRRKTLTRLFIDPQKTVSALVAFLRLHKDYDEVIGVGMCYSGLVFCGAQAAHEKKGLPLFDKLILDCSIYSMQEVVFNAFKDPLTCCNHKTGGAPKCVQWLMSTLPVRFIARTLGWVFLGSQFSNINVGSYLKHMHLPILFICAKDDKFISCEMTDYMYQESDKKLSCMVSLPSYHTLNHIKHKEIYAHLTNEFIRAPTIEEFVKIISNV